ncbi:preprotein translocase subunit SecE [Bacillota bacterium LX-D]|nr:preprotein translocase subunit SecE [Bacillota bacterium LX-D]
MATKSLAKPASANKAAKFFRGVISELKKVQWPNRKEILTYTLVVLASVFVVSAMIWIVDSIFSSILNAII